MCACVNSGFPGGLADKESTCQCRRCKFSPWVRKILWRRKWQPTSILLPGKPHVQQGWQSMGSQKSQTWLSDWITKQPAEMMSSYQWFLITFPLSNKRNYLESIWGWGNIGHRVRVQFSSLSHVQLFATPWTAACQASLSITNSHWRREWQTTSVFLPWEPHGQYMVRGAQYTLVFLY